MICLNVGLYASYVLYALYVLHVLYVGCYILCVLCAAGVFNSKCVVCVLYVVKYVSRICMCGIRCAVCGQVRVWYMYVCIICVRV